MEKQKLLEELAKLDAEERFLDDRINSIISRQPDLEMQLKNCSQLMAQLNDFKDDIGNFKSEIEQVNNCGQTISHKIRKLKQTKLRVAQCIRLLHDLQELESLKSNLVKAMEEDDLEQAAACIRRFHTRQLGYLNNCENKPTSDACRIILQAESDICRTAEEKFDRSIAERDVPEAMRFLKIFSLLSMHDIGISKFCQYVLSEMNNKLADKKEDDEDRKEKTSLEIAQQIGGLLDVVAELIEAHQPIFETYYDPGRLIDFVGSVLSECNVKFSSLMDYFRRVAEIDILLGSIDEGNAKKDKTFTASSVDLYNLMPILDQLCFIVERSEMFIRFLTRKLSENPENDADFVHQWVQNTKVNVLLQELVCKYVPLEDFATRETMRKACDLYLKSDDNRQVGSSIVDDVFFILQKSIRRAMNSSNTEGFCAVLNNSVTTLDWFRQKYLQKRIQQGCSNTLEFVTAMIPQQKKIVTNAESKVHGFMVTLNNLHLCTECTKTLKSAIRAEVERQSFSQTALGKIDTCLKEFDRCADEFASTLQNGCQRLQRDYIRPSMNRLCEEFLDCNHVINEVDVGSQDAFVKSCAKELQLTYDSLKQNLVAALHDTAVHLIANELASALERAIRSSTFNQLGGMLLEQEIRSITSFLSGMTDVPVINEFLRLNRIARVLSSESIKDLDSELHASEDGDQTDLVLSRSDMKQIAALRSDK